MAKIKLQESKKINERSLQRNNLVYNTHFFAGVAQLVEQLICNQPVAGSSPISSSKEFKALDANLRPFLLPRRKNLDLVWVAVWVTIFNDNRPDL